jgi:hypothetical protein
MTVVCPPAAIELSCSEIASLLQRLRYARTQANLASRWPTDPPLRQKSSKPPFDPQAGYRGRRLRLDGCRRADGWPGAHGLRPTAFRRPDRLRGCCLDQFQDALHQRQRLARRLWKTLSRGCERLVEILPIEPCEGAHALRQAVVPQPGDLDIECAVEALIDRLHPEAGNGPLPADPVDVAMQGHRSAFPKRALAHAGTHDSGSLRLRNIEGNYASRAITLSPPI